MTSDDDPFGSADRTVIRADPDTAPARRLSDKPPDARNRPDLTVFDPGLAHQPLPGWLRTRIAEGAAEDDLRLEQVSSSGGLRSPDDALLSSTELRYLSSNPILAAGGPVLVLLGRLQLSPIQTEAATLERHLVAAIEAFDGRLTATAVPTEDRGMAKFALCEMVDDIVGHLPDLDGNRWTDHRLLSRFFQSGSPGTGFFQALNRALTEPDKHLDLLEFMHACISLGFQGQYRSRQHDAGGLNRVRKDVYDTLRYFRPRAVTSPAAKHPLDDKPKTTTHLPIWWMPAGVVVVMASVYLVLRMLVASDAETAAEKLLDLVPAAPPVLERADLAPSTELPRSISQFEHIGTAPAKTNVPLEGRTANQRIVMIQPAVR